MRAIYSLTTPQGRKDTPSLIDVKGVDRPTEFTGKEKDFQQRSTKHGSVLFLGDQGVRDHVGQVTDMSSWSSRQARRMSSDVCFTQRLCCSRCCVHLRLSRGTRPMTLSPTRGRTRWKLCVDCRNDLVQRQGKNETCCLQSFAWTTLTVATPSWYRAHWIRCRATRKRLKDTLDDDIKLAGL